MSGQYLRICEWIDKPGCWRLKGVVETCIVSAYESLAQLQYKFEPLPLAAARQPPDALSLSGISSQPNDSALLPIPVACPLSVLKTYRAPFLHTHQAQVLRVGNPREGIW